MSWLEPWWDEIPRSDIDTALKLEAIGLVRDRQQVVRIKQDRDGAQLERVLPEERRRDRGRGGVAAVGRTLRDPRGEGPNPATGMVLEKGPHGAATQPHALLAEHALELGALPVLLDPDDLIPIVEEPDGFQFECGVDVAAGDLAPPGIES